MVGSHDLAAYAAANPLGSAVSVLDFVRAVVVPINDYTVFPSPQPLRTLPDLRLHLGVNAKVWIW